MVQITAAESWEAEVGEKYVAGKIKGHSNIVKEKGE